MNRFSDVATNFINAIIYSYCDEFIKNALRFELSKTNLRIQNLEFYPLSLLQHGLPLLVEKGIIENITMNLPKHGNSNKSSDKFKILIEDIFIHANFLAAPNQKLPTHEDVKRMESHMYRTHSMFKEKFLPLFKKLYYKGMNNKAKQLIFQLECYVKNFNLSINFGNGEGSFYLFIHIDSMSMFNFPNDPSQLTSISNSATISMTTFSTETNDSFAADFEKIIEINGLSIRYGTDTSAFDSYCTDTFKSKMLQRQNVPYIIDPFNISGIASYDTSKPELKIKFNHKDEVVLNLNVNQLRSFIAISPYLKIFRNFWYIKNIPRPKMTLNPDDTINEINDSMEDAKDYWVFAHRCAIEVNHIDNKYQRSSIFSRFIKAFKQRKKYLNYASLENSKNKTKLKGSPGKTIFEGPSPLEKFEHTLTYNQVILFRYMAEAMQQKWSKKLGVNEIIDALHFCSLDPGSLFYFFSDHTRIRFSNNSLVINVVENENKIGGLTMKTIFYRSSFSYEHFEFINKMKFKLSSFSHNIKSPEYDIDVIEKFDCPNSRTRYKMKYTTTKYFSNIKNSGYAGVLTAKINNEVIPINLKGIKLLPIHMKKMGLESLLDVFDSLKNRAINSTHNKNYNDDDEENESHYNYKDQVDINIDITAGQLKFKVDHDLFINLVFERFQFLRDDNDNYKISLKEGSIMLGTEIERVVATSISIDTIFVTKHKVMLYISPFFMNFNWKDIINLKRALAGFSKSIFHGIFSLPMFSDVEFEGGIPSVQVSIDIPSMSSLKYLNIETVKFVYGFDYFSLFFNQISFDEILDIENIEYKKGKSDITEIFIINDLQISLIQVLSYLPQDFLDVFQIFASLDKYSFLIRNSKIKISDHPSISNIMLLENFNGHFENESLQIKGVVKSVSINNEITTQLFPISTTIFRNNGINILIELGNIKISSLSSFLLFLFNTDSFSNKISLKHPIINCMIKVDLLTVENLVSLKNVVFKSSFSDNFKGIEISSKRVYLFDIPNKDKYPLLIKYNIVSRTLSVLSNFKEIQLDPFRVIETFKTFSSSLYNSDYPINIEIMVNPVTINDFIGKDKISLAFESHILMKLIHNNIDLISTVNNMKILLNDHKILSLNKLELINQTELKLILDNILIQLSVIDIGFIKKIINNFRVFLIDNNYIDCSNNSLFHSLIIQVNSIYLVFNNSYVYNFKNTSASLSNLTKAIINNQQTDNLLFHSLFSMDIIGLSGWFDIYEVVKPISIGARRIINEEGSITFEILSDDNLVIKTIPSYSIISKLTGSELKPIFSIQNNTIFHISISYNDILSSNQEILYHIAPNGNLQIYEYILANELILICENEKIPFKKSNFYDGYNVKVIFNNDEAIILEVINNCLHVNYLHEVSNKTNFNFTLTFQSNQYYLSPNSTISTKIINQRYYLDSCPLKNNVKKQIAKIDEHRRVIVTSNTHGLLIEPFCYITNRLPFDLYINSQIFISGQMIEFNPFESNEFYKDNKNKFHQKNMKAAVLIKSDLFNEKKIVIDFEKKVASEKFIIKETKQPFFVRIQTTSNDEILPWKITITPDIIIHNHTKNNNLFVTKDQTHKIYLDKTQVAFSPNKKLYHYLFIGSGFNNQVSNENCLKLEISESKAGYEKSTRIYLPSGNKSAITPLIILQNVECLDYANIIHLHIFPYIQFFNTTEKIIMVKSGVSSITIPPKQNKQLIDCSSTLDFSYEIIDAINFFDDNNNSYKTMNQVNDYNPNKSKIKFPLENQQVKKVFLRNEKTFFPFIIKYSNNEFNSLTKSIIFSIADDFPFRILNTTKFHISIIENTNTTAHKMFPYSSSRLLFNYTTSQLKIYFHELNANIDFNIQNPESLFITNIAIIPIQISNDVLEIKILEQNDINRVSHHYLHNFRFLLKSTTIKLSNNCNSSLESCSSLLNIKRESLMKIKLNQTKIEVDLNGDNATFDLCVHNAKMIDKHGQKLLSSIRGNLDQSNFIRIHSSFSGFYHINNIEFIILPFYLCYDISMVSQIKSIKNQNNIDLHEQFINELRNNKFHQRNSFIHYLDIFNSLIKVDALKLNMSKFVFTFKCNSKMSNGYSQFWRLFPNVLPINIHLHNVHYDSFDFKPKTLLKSIKNESDKLIKPSGISAKILSYFRFVGSMTCFGAPLYHIHRSIIIYKKLKNDGRPSFSPFLSIPVGILESLLDYFSSVLRVLGQSAPNPKKYDSPLLWSATSLFTGVLNGFMFFVSSLGTSIKRGKYTFIIHIIQSLFIFIANGGAGLLEALSGILCFIRTLLLDGDDEDDFMLLNSLL